MASPGRIELNKLSVEQLKGLKEQTDLEVNLLQDSLTKIHTATTRLENTSAALQDLSLRPHGKKMLVPLTASLYVPGSLDDAENRRPDSDSHAAMPIRGELRKEGLFPVCH